MAIVGDTSEIIAVVATKCRAAAFFSVLGPGVSAVLARAYGEGYPLGTLKKLLLLLLLLVIHRVPDHNPSTGWIFCRQHLFVRTPGRLRGRARNPELVSTPSLYPDLADSRRIALIRAFPSSYARDRPTPSRRVSQAGTATACRRARTTRRGSSFTTYALHAHPRPWRAAQRRAMLRRFFSAPLDGELTVSTAWWFLVLRRVWRLDFPRAVR